MDKSKKLLQALMDDDMLKLVIVKLISSDTLINVETCDESLSVIDGFINEMPNIIANNEKKEKCTELLLSAKDVCIKDKIFFQNENNKRQHK